MANYYTLTDILENGNWGSVTSPFIVEFHNLLDDQIEVLFQEKYENFRRILRISEQTIKRGEKSLGRGDDKNSADYLQCVLKTFSKSDASNIIEQIRDIIIKATKPDEATYDSTYSEIKIMEPIETAVNRGKYYYTFVIECLKNTKQRP